MTQEDYDLMDDLLDEPCKECHGYGQIFLEDIVDICTSCMGDGYKKD
jgi:DnaJ-class molecular chaperone